MLSKSNLAYLFLLLSLVFASSRAFNVVSVDSAEVDKAQFEERLKLKDDDDQFLEEIEKAAFLFFWEQTDPATGQVKDRAFANGSNDNRPVSSTASTGFGLTALIIGHMRGYRDKNEIEKRIEDTLLFVRDKLEGHQGFYYHFVDMTTGKRVWNCELSSIDTALLMNGVLSVKSYFKDNQNLYSLSKVIYERTNYTWFYNESSGFISMGWFPEKGFLESAWSIYCELMMLLLQAIGSPTHPVPVKAWHDFRRDKLTYEGMTYLTTNAPLFIHQFSHAWYDFRDKRDNYANYFDNSVLATKVHKIWCIKELGKNFSTYSENFWGLTASDTRIGYYAWGGPGLQGQALDALAIDGSMVPCAAAGSIPFVPRDTIDMLKYIKATYPKSWSRYGFVDAFNPQLDWYNPDVIGIDVGVTMLMAENHRTGFVWDMFMKNEEVARSMKLAGFKSAASSNTLVSNLTSILLVLFAFAMRNLTNY